MSVASWALLLSFARLAPCAHVVGSNFLARTSNATTAYGKNPFTNDRVAITNPFTTTVYGKSKCPCVGMDNLNGYYATHLDYYHVQYPLDAGSSCFPWELTTHPDCQGGGGPEWCSQSWCYVDPCNCEIEDVPAMSKSGVTYQGALAYFSYETCGFLDIYSLEMSKDACVSQSNQTACRSHSKCAWDGERKKCGGKKAMETCTKGLHLDETIYGSDDCRCVGVGGKEPGKAFMYINSVDEIEYPPDLGSTCKAWEADTHPDCLTEGKTPDWCAQRWCFVDPCKCKTAATPKMVMYENQNVKFQGKTAFWSAETCGNVDSRVKLHPEKYCLGQKTKRDCFKLAVKRKGACAWSGEACVGKALAGICDRQNALGVLGFDNLKSGSMRRRSFFALLMLLGALVAAKL